MAYKLKILLRAELEEAKAIEYYAEINDSLPKKFTESLELAYSQLKNSPYFQKRYGNIRGVPIKNFPYILFFIINENNKTVQILSCFHTAQNPKKYPE